jgi:hypothetical protein
MKKLMQIFDAKHKENGHLEYIGINSIIVRTELRQTNRAQRRGLG